MKSLPAKTGGLFAWGVERLHSLGWRCVTAVASPLLGEDDLSQDVEKSGS